MEKAVEIVEQIRELVEKSDFELNHIEIAYRRLSRGEAEATRRGDSMVGEGVLDRRGASCRIE